MQSPRTARWVARSSRSWRWARFRWPPAAGPPRRLRPRRPPRSTGPVPPHPRDPGPRTRRDGQGSRRGPGPVTWPPRSTSPPTGSGAGPSRAARWPASRWCCGSGHRGAPPAAPRSTASAALAEEYGDDVEVVGVGGLDEASAHRAAGCRGLPRRHLLWRPRRRRLAPLRRHRPEHVRRPRRGRAAPSAGALSRLRARRPVVADTVG